MMRAPAKPSARALDAWKYLALFAAAWLLFFLCSNRRINPYDEGIATISAVRLLAGQVPYRDFYYNYGPAPIYILASLFKLFGPAFLTYRLLDLFFNAGLMVTICIFVRAYCSRSTTLLVGAITLVWLIGSPSWEPLVCLILWSTWLVIPAFEQDQPARRTFLSGMLVACAALFRLDCGLALLGVHVTAVAVALLLRSRTVSDALRSASRMLWPYLLAMAVVLGPIVALYLSVATAYDYLFDTIYYLAKYYRLGRGLPFPGIHVASLQDLVIYVLLIVMALSLFLIARYIIASRRAATVPHQHTPRWIAFIITFTLLGAIMFGKGLVRISAGQMFLCIVPCILVLAVLIEHRSEFNAARSGVPLQRLLFATAALFLFTGTWTIVYQAYTQHKHRSSMLAYILAPSTQAPLPPFHRWCGEENPVTRGVCFLLDDDHIQTIEYLLAHTQPTDTLYVGLPHHDRIVADDNITYFATRRMPATHWIHFDPFLQNDPKIQQMMIADLEHNAPPYIAEDSEFEKVHEPNGSDLSNGVILLDTYIASHYQPVQTYGEMTILKRNQGQ